MNIQRPTNTDWWQWQYKPSPCLLVSLVCWGLHHIEITTKLQIYNGVSVLQYSASGAVLALMTHAGEQLTSLQLMLSNKCCLTLPNDAMTDNHTIPLFLALRFKLNIRIKYSIIRNFPNSGEDVKMLYSVTFDLLAAEVINDTHSLFWHNKIIKQGWEKKIASRSRVESDIFRNIEFSRNLQGYC